MKAMGMTPQDVEREGPGGEMAIGAVASLVSVLATALILTTFEDPTWADGAALGVVAGVGFVTASTFMNGVYEQKKPILGVLFGGYYTLGLVAAGSLLGAWR